MTELQWLSCNDPDLLLEQVVGKIDARQLSAFVCACWRRVDPPEGAISEDVRRQVEAELKGLSAWDAVRHASESVLQAARRAPSFAQERRTQGKLLRDAVGNPYWPATFPAVVMNLARALAAGADCGFALHDALVEAGWPTIAAHFLHRAPQAEAAACLRRILSQTTRA